MTREDNEDNVDPEPASVPEVAPWRVDQVRDRKATRSKWRGPHEVSSGVSSDASGPAEGHGPAHEGSGAGLLWTRHGLLVLLPVVSVVVSSVLGLARPMMELGGGLFFEVWAANLWGSLLFASGTIGSFLLVVGAYSWVTRNLGPGVQAGALLGMVPVALLSTWGVYAASWGFTGRSFDDTAFGFLYFAPVWDGNWNFVWEWGLPGILAMSMLMPGAAAFVARDPSPSGSSVTVQA